MKEAKGLIGTMKQELTHWDEAQNTAERARQWRELFRCAHVLKSTSGSMGFKQLEEFNMLLCGIFRSAKAKDLEIPTDVLSFLIEATGICETLLEGKKVSRTETILTQLKTLYEKVENGAEL
jgi:chemotaxis protein histidine kinase CheA